MRTILHLAGKSEKAYVYQVCGLLSSQQYSYYSHKSRQNRNDATKSVKYPCQWCGRNFSWPSSLRLHQKMACGKPPNFYCTICDYKSNFKGNLKRHLFCKHNIDLY
ncbi:PREDICTED: zinc finger X-chromosomal protein-like [Vollenhovia emeryi]|uniref:zinc finger X-chromosomal protein-like n=1 Tax=Vollenhovia emeryi TaxID=411798 RepID=UPI0005F4BAC7|nr:PREDICTED: zinc finger X-chromosomal protein-like [Vollenhovia emeryi]